MSDFDVGGTLGRFFWSIIDNPYFVGISARIGIDNTDDGKVSKVFAISMQVGYLMFSIGWVIDFAE